jgi:hypothetical protein
MTITAKSSAWRDEQRKLTTTKTPRGASQRFEPMNALADGNWISTLTRRQLAVWLILYRHATPDGTVRIAHSTIARLAGLRREHAARTTAALERHGLIHVRVRGRQVGQTGSRTANEYKMLIPRPYAISATGGTMRERE